MAVSIWGTDRTITSYPAVPQQLLSKIDHVFALIEKDSISKTRISTLLELLSKACKYSHSVSQEEFRLHEASVTALDNSDAAFKRFLSSRMTEEEDQAKEELDSCEHFAGELPDAVYVNINIIKRQVISECFSVKQLILQCGVPISACACHNIYIHRAIYVSLGPVMCNTLHSIAPGSGSICSWPDRVWGVRSTVNASLVLALVLLEDIFSSLSSICPLLKSCQQPLQT